MHVPREPYPIERLLGEHLPHLRPPQRRGLALSVPGAVLARSACQPAVVAALLPQGRYHALLCPSSAPAPGLVAGTRPGVRWLRHLLARGRLWRRSWRAPEPWPQPPPGRAVTLHGENT